MKDRAEWLEERRKGIGGSDAAAILGLSKFQTPYTLWADKKGLLPPKEDTEAMRQGRDLEDIVAQRFTEETGIKVRRDSRTIKNPAYPYSYAHIDRRVVGRAAGLECKTCSPYRRDEFADGKYPIEYYTQCLHYLAVTGWDEWYLAVMVLGVSFDTYVIKRADVLEDMEKIEAAVIDFWEKYILADVAPEPDGLPQTRAAINAVLGISDGGRADLSGFEEVFEEIARLKAEIDGLKLERERREQKIKLAMGASEYSECGDWTVTWKPRKDGVRVFSIK